MTYRDEDEEIIDGALDTLAWQRREIDRLKTENERLRATVEDLLTRFEPWSPHDFIAVERASAALKGAEQ